MADPDTAYVLMTEQFPLPNVLEASTLIYWAWDTETIKFIGASAQRSVKVLYWKSLTIPTVNTSYILFINGELYLAPRTAALAAGSIGQKEVYLAMAAEAEAKLTEVVLVNRGRVTPTQGVSMRP